MKFRKGLYIVFGCVGITLFVFSLLPFFRNLFAETFWIMTVFGLLLTGFCIFALLYRPREKGEKPLAKYERKASVMSRTEHKFLYTLRQINPAKYEVLPKVALFNVINKVTNAAYRNELFRVCDYCFVDKDTFEPLLLVELNDSSHKRADRRMRDEKVAAICRSAGLPLVTFWLNEDLSYIAVKKIIIKNILN